MLTESTLSQFQTELRRRNLDGWLIFDFHGLNPVAAGLLPWKGMATRRIFALIPSAGAPVAITHAIEQDPWRDWPAAWGKLRYSGWRELESHLASLVKGKRVAMEYSPGDAVPYVDRIPAGVLEMVRAAGAEVVSSGELVTIFYALWSDQGLASHRRAAEVVAAVARDACTLAGERSKSAQPITEYELQRWIVARFVAAGLDYDHPAIVGIGANAANPHYEPSEQRSSAIERGSILLIDLWARETGGIFADQTWMASLGPPSERAHTVWRAVRDARDAAIALLVDRIGRAAPVLGAEVDDASRDVIRSRGFADYFTHRTGHSIDPRDLHGSGPHIDNLESREERPLVPGVGFSIEPGVYIPGEIGMRTEVNGFIGKGEVIITPVEMQRELIIV